MNILLILISVLLNCAAQLCIRKGMLIVGEVGMSGMVQNLGAMISNLWLWGAMVCYAVSILMWMAVLSKVEVSFAYPFLSIGYVCGKNWWASDMCWTGSCCGVCCIILSRF